MRTNIEEPNTDPNQMWSIGKVGMVLDVSKSTIERLIEEGAFGEIYKFRRTTRVPMKGVLEYISKSKKAGGDDAMPDIKS